MITVHKRPNHKPYPHSKIMSVYKQMGLVAEGRQLEMWEMQDGDVVMIKDLRLNHIQNILVFMEERPYWRQDQKPLLLAELDRRKKKQLIDKTKAGALLYANS